VTFRLDKLHPQATDHHFWQVLIACSAQEFLEHGLALIASLELESPDGRVLIWIADASSELGVGHAFRNLGRQVRSLHLYRVTAGAVDAEQTPQVQELQVLQEVLSNTRMPTLLLGARSIVRRDLTLLPVELQKCDVAVYESFKQPRLSRRVEVGALWVQLNDRTLLFLEQLQDRMKKVAQRKGGALEAADLRRATFLTLTLCRRFIKFAGLPKRYADWKCGPKSFIWLCPPGLNPSESFRTEVERLKTALAEPVDGVVFFPKQDVGTKNPLVDNQLKTRVRRLGRPGRQYWRHAARLVLELTRRQGIKARIVVLPQWEILGERLAEPGVKRFVLPHINAAQTGSDRTWTYMQEILPDLFTFDPRGWGASATYYGASGWDKVASTSRADALVVELTQARTTKAPQRVAHTATVVAPYDVLVPLQVPGDESLQFHSDCSLEQFVDAVLGFASATGKRLLIKKHPFDQTVLASAIQARVDPNLVQVTDEGHIHDLIQRAEAVCVINSGVGFEAMLYDKPVFVFGRAIYDEVVCKVGPESLIDRYEGVVNEPVEARRARYRRFMERYVYEIGFKLDQSTLNLARDRLGPTMEEPNPVLERIEAERGLQLNGIKLQKVPPSDRRWLKLKGMLLLKGSQWAKRWRMYRARAEKKVDRVFYTRLKSWRLKPLPADLFQGKTVALVGNAGSIRGTAQGLEIDAHDIVIRMNLGHPLMVRKDVDIESIDPHWIAGCFEDRLTVGMDRHYILKAEAPKELLERCTNVRDVGRRTDVWSCSTKDTSRQLFFGGHFQGAHFVACHPNYAHLHMDLITQHRVMKMPQEAYQNLRDRYEIEPTSGLIWFEYLRQTEVKSLDMYGFDFFDSKHVNRATQTLSAAQGKWPHSPQDERRHVLHYAEIDPRIEVHAGSDRKAEGHMRQLNTTSR
jgi:CDP-glycerol glycerophosphotransferase (TagB/SpsB family)